MGESADIFRFKKFDIINERSAMKVNTDGVLLGAAMTITSEDRHLLDIGTGTGTIALMAAQRLTDMLSSDVCNDDISCGSERSMNQCSSGAGHAGNAPEERGVAIQAIDIDEPSASEAAANFRNSPWSDILHAYNLSLDEFVLSTANTPYAGQQSRVASGHLGSYDLIFSNPPYFEDSLTAPDERKSTARHTSDGLSYRDVFDFAKESLTPVGRVAMILPSDQEAQVCRYARMCGLHLYRILRIRTVPRKSPIRIIVEFSRRRTETPEDSVLTIQNEGKYTQEYLSLTKDFYLFA